ncbi:hypothetical protein [Spirosoma agri]|uniref:Uncharacterized protein n=1 Tax=Spirosoma agri TaxID=1987381 RepID=A0A6M0IEK4_9BACT|nr:hypothetical protein [Spirosoma agri]NEU66699.1 hypothetical protein [Spirosoma agri]
MVDFTKLLTGILIAGAASFSACRSSETTPQEELPADYLALKTGSSVQTSTGLAVRADSVTVSICPDNANCFAPNSAGVVLRLSKASQSQSVRLFAWIPNYTRRPNGSQVFTDSAGVDFSGQRYKVILRNGHYSDRSNPERSSEVIVQVSPIE